MRVHPAIPFYIPGLSIFHKLHIGAKVFLFLSYVVIIFLTKSLLALIILMVGIVGLTIYCQLPILNRSAVSLSIILIILALLTANSAATLLALSICKITDLILILCLFNMTTQSRDILQLLSPSGKYINGINSIVYSINTTLAVFPSIQYELQRSIDAETIRRGTPVKIYSIQAWDTILTVLLIRIMVRSERFTDSVLDRGYIPSKMLQITEIGPVKLFDILFVICFIACGILIGFYL